MVSDDEFFNKDGEAEIIDMIPKGLTSELKAQRDNVMQVYAKLIANPYLAPQLVPDMRSALMATLAILMENGVPVSVDPKVRTPDDVIREGMAELGGMIGAKGIATILRMKNNFTETMRSEQEDDTIYRDPDSGTYYFIDSDGVEVDCDKHGNVMEE